MIPSGHRRRRINPPLVETGCSSTCRMTPLRSSRTAIFLPEASWNNPRPRGPKFFDLADHDEPLHQVKTTTVRHLERTVKAEQPRAGPASRAPSTTVANGQTIYTGTVSDAISSSKSVAKPISQHTLSGADLSWLDVMLMTSLPASRRVRRRRQRQRRRGEVRAPTFEIPGHSMGSATPSTCSTPRRDAGPAHRRVRLGRPCGWRRRPRSVSRRRPRRAPRRAS